VVSHPRFGVTSSAASAHWPELPFVASTPALLFGRSYCPLYRLHHGNFKILLVIAKVYQLGQIGLEVLFIEDRVIAFAIVKTAQPGSNYSGLRQNRLKNASF
jgi:hypothetical protein